MDKNYKYIAILFVAVSAIVLGGFYNTYFVFFPDFEGFKVIHHFHGFIMVLWLVVLIVQPILISKRKYTWHRAIGKFSYGLVPIIVVTMFLAYKNSYLMGEANGTPHAKNLLNVFLPLTDIIPFSTFYLLAVIHKSNVGKHLRFMISTSLVVVIAGMIRICMFWIDLEFLPTVFITSAIIAGVFVAFILYDYSKGKAVKNNPFVTALIIFSIPNVLLTFVPDTAIWQSFADGLLAIF